MRRVNAWLLVPAVLLALGVGVLIGQAGDDDGNDTAAGRRTEVLGQQFERDETTTTQAEETTTTAAETTTTAAAAAAATTTTVPATTATTAVTTATTAAPTVTTTTGAAATACGTGSAGAGASLVVTGAGPPSNPTFTYNGTASVRNDTGKPIEITALGLRLESTDGTREDVAVAGAPGTVIPTGTTRDFSFTHQTSHPPKDDGASVSSFAYKPPGGTKNCASI